MARRWAQRRWSTPSEPVVSDGSPDQPGGPGGGADTPPATAATAQSQGGGSPPSKPRGGKPSAVADAGDRVEFKLGDRILAAANTPRYDRQLSDPVYRPLKIYTIDPSRRRGEGQTAEINIPYEQLEKGPVGVRFAVSSSGKSPLGKYDDVDLNDVALLINNGRDPAPTDPVFHHQMVYAVAMSTYAVFRTALGREIGWGFHNERLNLVPHSFEDANARYVRDEHSGALEFGWYKVVGSDKVGMPSGAIIYSCLSHDIIAHELTHALLDGLRTRFDRSTNPDVSAFHEAFADLVALLQRFSYREVVRNIILTTQGDLRKGGDWLQFVYELAHGKGEQSLRVIDIEGVRKYDPKIGEHDLGTVLVSAIIEAFVTIYTRKAAPVIRMATGRTTIADGEAMSADLVNHLTHIASRLASHLLTMCIRAIDYCPPVDITLGEYLRALITADRDLVPDDDWSYREALIDAFRKRRIFPDGVTALTEDALLWERPKEGICVEGLNFGMLRFAGDPGRAANPDEVKRQANLIGETACLRKNLEIFGLADPKDPEFGNSDVEPPFVTSVRTSRRVGPDGQLAFDLVAEVIQRRTVPGGGGYPEFKFRGGSTIVFNSKGEVRYVVAKNIKSKDRLQRQRDYAAVAGAEVYALGSCRHEQKDSQAPPVRGAIARRWMLALKSRLWPS